MAKIYGVNPEYFPLKEPVIQFKKQRGNYQEALVWLIENFGPSATAGVMNVTSQTDTCDVFLLGPVDATEATGTRLIDGQ